MLKSRLGEKAGRRCHPSSPHLSSTSTVAARLSTSTARAEYESESKLAGIIRRSAPSSFIRLAVAPTAHVDNAIDPSGTMHRAPSFGPPSVVAVLVLSREATVLVLVIERGDDDGHGMGKAG